MDKDEMAAWAARRALKNKVGEEDRARTDGGVQERFTRAPPAAYRAGTFLHKPDTRATWALRWVLFCALWTSSGDRTAAVLGRRPMDTHPPTGKHSHGGSDHGG